MSILEALACGTPVIGADIGGIPEIVHNNESGYLFPSGDADSLATKIEYLLDHPEESARMGRIGRTQVEKINDPESHYAATLAAYGRVCAQHTGVEPIPRAENLLPQESSGQWDDNAFSQIP